MKTKHKYYALVLTGLGLFLAGRWTSPSQGDDSSPPAAVGHEHAAQAAGSASPDGEMAMAEEVPEIWTCPMHPQIKLPDSGDCPICGMDLVLLDSSGDTDPRRISMSPAARELAQIQTVPVERRELTASVRMVGKVSMDETRMRTVSAWVGGRLDRLFVDYTGIRVKQGDHLVRLYSPDLLTAQEELLAARQRYDRDAGSASSFLTASNQRSYQATREKLLLWGLTEKQLDALEQSGEVQDMVTIPAPIAGIVMERLVEEGSYVETGTPIYRLADLSKLWVQLDAFEQDLAWLRYGQEVALTVEALPGETVSGRISFIEPVIDPHRRTAKVRVTVDNSDGRLKPGMFARAVVQVRVGEHGLALDRSLAGKWISPMHPEIVKDEAGVCDVCGIDLVTAESLGLVAAEGADESLPLVVPVSAVLVTGKRAVAYVDVPGAEKPTFEGREILLGPRAGDYYLVREGLAENERVVSRGAFRIDSAMQIQAKPSMMSMPAEQGKVSDAEIAPYRSSLNAFYREYLQAQVALALDDFSAAQSALVRVAASLEQTKLDALPADLRREAKGQHARIQSALEHIAHMQGIAELRVAFEESSNAAISLARTFGQPGEAALHEAFCPMAFDDAGASWLQSGEKINNPYFGSEMLGCGEIRSAFGVIDPSSSPSPVSKDQESSPPMKQVKLVRDYLAMQVALAADDLVAAQAVLPALAESMRDIGADSFSDPPEPADLEWLRVRFDLASTRLIAWVAESGNPLGDSLHVAHCPMAFDDIGADWLQIDSTISNPYFGAEMLRCGSITKTEQPR
jgi:membrane fusion protein, copper/silver efflux system